VCSFIGLDAQRITNRVHSIHGHRLDVRLYYLHMGIEPFIDASNVGKQPDPIHCQTIDDSRYILLLKNRSLYEQLEDQLKSLYARLTSSPTNDSIEITFNHTRCTVKHRLEWRDNVMKMIEQFLVEHLVVHQVPWNNNKIPAITSEQLHQLSLKDNTRWMQLSPSERQSDHIVVTALKEQLDRALSDLTDMLTASNVPGQSIPLTDAIYRSKPVTTARDPRVDNHRSSLFLRSSPSKEATQKISSTLSSSNLTIDDYFLENLRLYQLDLLAMRFIDLARRIYLNLSIDIERTKRRIHLHGSADQVLVCKNYFESILHGIVHRHYNVGKEMAIFLSNPDTGE
jgi:hypothetical protein